MRRLLACLATAAAALGGLTVAAATPAAAATSGSFSVLSYNIAGLPESLSSASTPRDTSTTAIGTRIAPYDIVNVQEDFNYHAYLYSTDTHPYRTATSGGAGIGSGLNTVSNYAWDGDDFERVHWNSCQIDSGDCLTPKGFTFMRERLSE
ncbi:jacalin-like lectin, partial [Streptomyces sp. NPDC001100]